ncbi:hypothetical protein P6144_15240 [Sphingomonas sp. HITSZ_GF]|uniref:hypothetical protein n=1 Tax=Sphingomonas sp. HITSZ_GF TaxID=3037247 RepID=UPI00240E8A9B|nr:hypothetical protein [Sphingomonas sp. HITSZ_GF]MDG2535013.1 hypothetical protein [Sphingomonas sp. HITSZ_GF]
MARRGMIAAVTMAAAWGSAALLQPAHAQTQTKAGAKTFLQMTLAGMRFNRNASNFHDKHVEALAYIDKWTGRLNQVIQNPNECVISFNYTRDSFSHREFEYYNRNTRQNVYSDWGHYSAQSMTVNLDFTKINNVAQDGMRVHYSTQGLPIDARSFSTTRTWPRASAMR